MKAIAHKIWPDFLFLFALLRVTRNAGQHSISFMMNLGQTPSLSFSSMRVLIGRSS